MKTAATLALLSLLLAAPAAAQEAGQLGLGVMLGAPTGGTAKYWLAPARAVDFAIGYSGNLAFHGDYLWHAWDIFPKPREGKLAGYLGLGGRLRNRERDDIEFGFRASGGVAYWLERHPIELFVELAPVLRVNASDTLDLDGALGLRFFFEPSRR